MSKKGGTSEVNGFISIGAESKGVKRKDGSVSKKENDEISRRRTDSKNEATQSRARMNNASGRKESSSKYTSGKKELISKPISKNSENSLNNKLERKESIKKEPSSLSPSRKTVKQHLTVDKHKAPTKELHRSYSEMATKVKGAVSSSSISSKGAKPKNVQSTPQLKKSSLVTGQSKDSPYRSSVAQKPLKKHTSSYASGDRLRKTSQLKETSVKSKESSLKTSTSRTKTQLESESTLRKKSSPSNSSLSKSQKEGRKKPVAKISEESDTESQQSLKPYGEIPRSNTFTKDGGEADTNKKTQENLTLATDPTNSLSHVDLDDDYQYEEDFEDYESDFEEYMESDDDSCSISKSEEQTSTSDSDSLDEDERGDGYKVNNLTTDLDTHKNNSPVTTELKNDNNASDLNDRIKILNLNEKEKSSQVEEEKKLDSGSYDLTSHSDLRRKKQIQDIRAAIDQENSNLSTKMRHKRRSVIEDEGFEEAFSQEASPTLVDASYSPTEGLINFEYARKQQISQKAKAKVKKRGAILMEMIKLDVMSFSLLDIPSVPYEVYMQCYGRSNTLQIHTQTNEDAASEEVQTEDISTSTKWTQHPIKYSSPQSPDDLLSTFSREKLGVGGENTVDDKADWFPKLHVNSLRLHNFINNAGEMILTLLEEDERDRKVKVSSSNKRDFGFSDSYFSLNVQKVKFLKKRPVSLVCFSESNSSHILSVHKPSTEPLTIQAESEGRCVLCTWSIREPSCPLQTLVASNHVASVCYHSFLVLAGLIDGALCLWDLREQSVVHARCYLREPEWLLRSPTYITADIEKNQRHSSPVVSIKILPESNPDDSAKATTDKLPRQVASLDEDGLLAIWTVVESKSTVNINSGLAPWGKIRIVQSSQLRILKAFPKPEQSGVQCRCLVVDRLKPSNLYIGTNTGQVVHVLQTSCRARPQFYSRHSGANTSISCMEFSRCGYPLLMVGDSVGRVQIYRTLTERPLLDLSASDITPGPSLKCLQWSSTQPGLFFVLDSNSCIHVWDLCSSDMCPQMSVPFTSNNITCISLTPHLDSKILAVASDIGTVDVYNLKDEFGSLPKQASDEQHNIFSRYITIL